VTTVKVQAAFNAIAAFLERCAEMSQTLAELVARMLELSNGVQD
jgi:hypothetical protein